MGAAASTGGVSWAGAGGPAGPESAGLGGAPGPDTSFCFLAASITCFSVEGDFFGLLNSFNLFPLFCAPKNPNIDQPSDNTAKIPKGTRNIYA
ncbi:MAG: hypothetical protein CXT69_01610 [Methanobacteriota archaeon]|nr:MAG: hypothetical protein CXT69_01610 [Euryarchaeota archaeon]